MRLQMLSRFLFLTALLLSTTPAFAQTTVRAPDQFSYGANIGWIDWRGDVVSGASFGLSVASGFIYSANVGWIDLGDGTPQNGVAYANNSADDFGVNIDAASDPDFFILSGFAYSANAGWINFNIALTAGAEFQPRIKKQTGILKGFAYGANIGWLPLESMGISRVNTGLSASGIGGWELYR